MRLTSAIIFAIAIFIGSESSVVLSAEAPTSNTGGDSDQEEVTDSTGLGRTKGRKGRRHARKGSKTKVRRKKKPGPEQSQRRPADLAKDAGAGKGDLSQTDHVQGPMDDRKAGDKLVERSASGDNEDLIANGGTGRTGDDEDAGTGDRHHDEEVVDTDSSDHHDDTGSGTNECKKAAGTDTQAALPSPNPEPAIVDSKFDARQLQAIVSASADASSKLVGVVDPFLAYLVIPRPTYNPFTILRRNMPGTHHFTRLHFTRKSGPFVIGLTLQRAAGGGFLNHSAVYSGEFEIRKSEDASDVAPVAKVPPKALSLVAVYRLEVEKAEAEKAWVSGQAFGPVHLPTASGKLTVVFQRPGSETGVEVHFDLAVEGPEDALGYQPFADGYEVPALVMTSKSHSDRALCAALLGPETAVDAVDEASGMFVLVGRGQAVRQAVVTTGQD